MSIKNILSVVIILILLLLISLVILNILGIDILVATGIKDIPVSGAGFCK